MEKKGPQRDDGEVGLYVKLSTDTHQGPTDYYYSYVFIVIDSQHTDKVLNVSS